MCHRRKIIYSNKYVCKKLKFAVFVFYLFVLLWDYSKNKLLQNESVSKIWKKYYVDIRK